MGVPKCYIELTVLQLHKIYSYTVIHNFKIIQLHRTYSYTVTQNSYIELTVTQNLQLHRNYNYTEITVTSSVTVY